MTSSSWANTSLPLPFGSGVGGVWSREDGSPGEMTLAVVETVALEGVSASGYGERARGGVAGVDGPEHCWGSGASALIVVDEKGV